MTPDDGERPAPPPEAAETPAPPGAGPRRRRVLALAALVVLALAGAAALRLWGPAGGGGGEAPLLRAEPGPLRERPADPGGMEVPYRDVLALHELGMPPDEAAEPAVERLLPPPEEPLPKPAAPQDAEGGIAVAPLDAPNPAAPEPEPAPPPAEESEPAEPEPAASSPVETESAEAESAPPPAEPDPADPIGDVLAGLPDGPGGAGAFAVQLGAWSTRAEAEAGWTRVLARAPELLEAVARFVVAPEEADSAGGLHRLRAGPMPDRADAEALCAGLADAGVPCFVVAQ